jgi:hypothetical protein
MGNHSNVFILNTCVLHNTVYFSQFFVKVRTIPSCEINNFSRSHRFEINENLLPCKHHVHVNTTSVHISILYLTTVLTRVHKHVGCWSLSVRMKIMLFTDDRTRVVLEGLPHDYVNASYVNVRQ